LIAHHLNIHICMHISNRLHTFVVKKLTKQFGGGQLHSGPQLRAN